MADKKQFAVSPSLFIGIGTNGWRILNELRQLMYEEFGRGGLACFRYVGIESDSDKKPDDSFLPHRPEPFEKVFPVYISIADVNVIRRRVNSKFGEDFMPGLDDWLDPSLIERGSKSYKAGAGNARQAGRMCLWENWKQFTLAVSSALDAIKNPDNIVAAEEFLKDDYFPKKRRSIQTPGDNLVNAAPKVYIFGTLCGGTCSGSFIDIAYYVLRELGLLSDVKRGIIRGVADPEVIGLFTISDLRLLSETQTRRSVGNCWAALRELDFYYQKEGHFHATFPDGTTIDTLTEPFDTVYLESLRNLAGTGFDRNDYDGLAQMCAMNLFTETVAGLAGPKNESRVNLRQTAPGYLEPNHMGHIRAFSSFGVSAFWYPKYRITQAMNRNLAEIMITGWLGATVQSNMVKDQAEKDWSELAKTARGSLVGSIPGAQCNINLNGIIEDAFAQRESDFLEVGEEDLASYLVNFPTSDSTFAQRLRGPGGDYFSRMANAEPLVGNDLKNATAVTVDAYFREHTCAESKEYITALLACADRDTGSLPSEIKSWSQDMDVSFAAQVQHAWWAKSVGLHKEAVNQYKRSLWSSLKQRVQDQVSQLRDYFLKKTLMRCRTDMVNVMNVVNQAEARLRILRDTCAREKQKLIEFRPPGHIVTIAGGEQNTIAEDVDFGTRQILKEVDPGSLRKHFVGEAHAIKLLTTETEEALRSRIDLSFGQYCSSITNSFQIPKKVLTTSRNRIPDLINRAAPYVEPIASFRPLETKDTPNFLFCSEMAAGEELVSIVNEKLKDTQYKSAYSPLDHFVIFYHEAVGLALSDLAVADRASGILAELEKDLNRTASSFTHKAGEKMFDAGSVQRCREVTKWIKCMRYLDPEAFEYIGKDLVLAFATEEGLTKHFAVESPEAIRQYVENSGSEALIKRFCERLKALGRQLVLDRMTAEGKKAQSHAEKERLDGVHLTILKVVFN